MIERLRKAGRQADIRAIFSAPTLAELAKSLKHATKKEIPSNNIPEGVANNDPDANETEFRI